MADETKPAGPPSVPTSPVDPAPRTRRRFAFPIIGVVAIVLVTAVVLLVAGFFTWTESVCGPTPEELHAARWATREIALVSGLVIACVPALCALYARSRKRAVWPWVMVTGVFLFATVATAATAQPDTWCLY